MLLIFYFPNCQQADGDVKLAKFAEENNIPYLLISDTYSPNRMKELYLKYDLKNNNQYVIPTIDKKQKSVLKKRLEFMKVISQEGYLEYKDGLIFGTVVKVSNDGVTKVNPIITGGSRKVEFLIDWIGQE